MTEISKNTQVPQCDKAAVMQSVILPHELRIGNATQQGVVKSFWERGVHVGFGKCYEFNELKPIKATEEELLKLGFEKVYDGNYKRYQINLLETNIYLRPSLEKWYFGFINNGQDCEINDCYELEFIHEIQNLIFSLTRVSLTVALRLVALSCCRKNKT